MIVLEIQKSAGNVATLTTVHATRAEAEQKYHTVLAYAAVSSISVHAAVMMEDDGLLIKRESYEHEEATEA